MVHFYPQGALQCEADVEACHGRAVYSVYGLGLSSSVQEHVIVYGARVTNVGNNSNTRVIAVENRYGRPGVNEFSNLFIGDRNIGCHHNHHYLFHSWKNAEAYLNYAKKNTESPKPDPWYEDLWGGSYYYDDLERD